MSTDLLIDRTEDRVDYLCTQRDWGVASGVEFDKHGPIHYSFEARVHRWLSSESTKVGIAFRAGAFSFQNVISADEARLLALALSTAADEAEEASQ